MAKAANPSLKERVARPLAVPAMVLDRRYTPFGLAKLDKSHESQFRYRSAQRMLEEGVVALGGSGAWHALYDRRRMVDQSRQFYMDNSLYRGMIDRAVTNIISGGFQLQARSGSPTWNAKAEALWAEETQRPEIRGLLSWRQQQQMVCREILLTGETGAIKVAPTEARASKLQMVESECIAHGTIPDGVEVDTVGRPVKYHICPYSTFGQVDTAQPRPYLAETEFLWAGILSRPSEVRAVPPAEAAFAMLHRINDICDSEALAWQVLSRLAISVQKEKAGVWGQQVSIEDPLKANQPETAGDLANRLVELDAALVFLAKPGEEVKGIERNLPGANFPEALRMFLRILGLPIGLPLELTLLDFSQTNYSSIRGALEQAHAAFEDTQWIIEDRYDAPWYRWKIDLWVEGNKLRRRSDQYDHEWIKPSFPWLDQLKEAQATGLLLDRAMMTHSEACKAVNRDRDALVQGRVAEVKNAIAVAKQIKEETGEKVPWQMFAGITGGGSNPTPPPPAEPRDDGGEMMPRAPRQPSDDGIPQDQGAGDQGMMQGD